MSANRKLVTKEFGTINQIKGPLIFAERISGVAYHEIVEIIDPEGKVRLGRVLEIDHDLCMIQVFVSTKGLDQHRTRLRFTGDVGRIDLSITMLGRILNGYGKPLDDGMEIMPEVSADINGLPINPTMRVKPREFIQTGISALDGMNTLARGQKLPIFSGSGLPGNQLAAQIATQARVPGIEEGKDEPFSVVFAAIGITHRESAYFIEQFKASGALERAVLFLNHADDPTVERILTPRAALATAEYLAFQHDRHVLVILTDMTNYCEALREISAAREEIPGRRGYPGYMYSDLASIYERAGRLKGHPGSVTQIMVLSMPDDDITHPIPDLTGYITEGQIVLSRELHQEGIKPPINVLPSLSRLMDTAIGKGLTREDHRHVSNQLYAFYADGLDLRRLAAIIGEDAVDEKEKVILKFSKEFESMFINQGFHNRDIEETLDIAWELLREIPAEMLKRIPQDIIDKYLNLDRR
ncbi:MAG: V-type ATP synthase subunit B [Anaerolineaceae bacterium]|nr:V-type ATP synthase subunit B [Anaerolineaceae bacterium]